MIHRALYKAGASLLIMALVGLLAACGDSSSYSGPVVGGTDQDQDGLSSEDDCDDTDADVGGPERYYRDGDGDGMGDSSDMTEACEAPDRHVKNDDDPEPDCATNDTDDCGVCGGEGGTLYYSDVDGDGLGDARSAVRACSQPDGYTTNDDDQQPECATNNTDECGVCAGPGRATFYADIDGDGMGDARAPIEACARPDGYVDNSGDPEPDCETNDTDECGVCAGENADKDCNGVCFGGAVIDECGLCGGPGLFTFYTDIDEDGLGDPEDALDACEQPQGYVTNGDDLEPDCATNDTDECGVCAGPGPSMFYADQDNDGQGDARTPIQACEQPEGFVDNDTDPEPDCETNDTDECGVCAGGNASRDCNGVCDGEAFRDECNRCVGGETGLEPATEDSDMDGVPDLCEEGCQLQPRFIAQWTAVPPYVGNGGSSDAAYTFQVVLYENGDILFQHADYNEFNASPTVGIQNANGSDAIEFGHNSNFVVDQPVTVMYRDRDDRFIADYALERYWYDISRVGTPVTLGDDASESFDLGFEFPFWDQTYSSISIHSNGFLFFGEAGCTQCYQNPPLPNAQVGALIAPFWDDLNPSAGGQIYVYTAPPTCDADCNGVVGGFAYEEPECNSCVTGLETGPIIDCNGVCGGTAAIDGCGLCAGGDTGLEPQELDCTGACGGTAYYDACRNCVGGDTGLEPTDPAECPSGVDLIVDQPYLADTIYIDYIDVAEDDCLINERCVRGSGRRKLIRFGTQIANIGNEDLVLGVPNDEGEYWHYDECHNHYHYEAYAAYQLQEVGAPEPLDIGSKNGFCVIDIAVYDPSLVQTDNGRCRGYNCGDQGITAGCQDTYSASLQCQWIDVTGLDDGEYDVIVITNPEGEIEELDLDNNSATVRVLMEGDELTVIDDNP